MRPRPAARASLATRAGFLALASVLASPGCSHPLPEQGTAQATLYADRCGGCHALVQPAALTPSMWKLQVERMDQKYRAVGRPAPTSDEKARILEYLTRNAGG